MISHSIASVFAFIQKLKKFFRKKRTKSNVRKKFLKFCASWYIMKQKYTKKDGQGYGIIRTVAFGGIFRDGR